MERGGAEVLQDQGEAPAILLQGDPFAHAGQVANVLEDTKLAPQPGQLPRCGVVVARHLDGDGDAVKVTVAAVDGSLGPFVDLLRERVVRQIKHRVLRPDRGPRREGHQLPF